MHVDLIVHNVGQLVTCASGGRPKRAAEMRDVGIVDNGSVAIDGGRFVAVGRTEEILQRFVAAEQIDAEENAVCPGFVDPHTHIIFAGDRLNEFELKLQGADYLDILAAGGGIISTVKQTRAATLDELVKQSRVRLDAMLACGTTTCEIKTGYGLDLETELRMLEAIAELDRTHSIQIIPTLLAAHAVPPEFTGDSNGYVDLICNTVLPQAWGWYGTSRFSANNVPFYIDVFTEKNAFDVDQSRRILETATQLGFGLKAHVDEFTNLGGSRLAIGMGASSIDHLDAISDDEIELLAASNTVGIVTPTVNFNFGSSHFADARRLIDSGCVVALSTDYNPGSAPCPSQPMAMAIACRYQKLLPAEVMNAATVNAAFGIDQGADVGSIEEGKRADMLILETTDYRQTAYEFGGNLVKTVIKDGRVVLEN